MRCYISVVCALSVLAALSYAAPTNMQQLATLDEQENNLIKLDPEASTDNSLIGGRFRRNIQLLRQFCPQLFQVIDNVIQNITSQVFRVVGRVILQSGGLGGGGSNGGTSSVSVVLPTFPPDEEDEDENDQVQTTATDEKLNITIIDSRTSNSNESTFAPMNIALSVNEIPQSITEDTLFTDDENNTQRNKQEGNVSFLSRIGNLDNDTVNDNAVEYSTTEILLAKNTNKIINVDDDSSTTKISTENLTSEYEEIPYDTRKFDKLNGVFIDLRSLGDDDDFKLTTIEYSTTEAQNSIDSIETVNDNIDLNPLSVDNDSSTTENEIIEKYTEKSLDDAETTTKIYNNLDIKILEKGIVINKIPLLSNDITSDIDDDNTILRPIEYTSPASSSDSFRSRRLVREADDQDAAASGGNAPNPGDDLSNVDAEDADRDKRYLPFGGDAHVSAGGSGNFLFDIIRLIAGSGATEESDEKENAPIGAGGVAELDVAKSAEAHEGIPGPITRLFVIANRGLANLVQDLILRLAQTSERIVNFKARLITALI